MSLVFAAVVFLLAGGAVMTTVGIPLAVLAREWKEKQREEA